VFISLHKLELSIVFGERQLRRDGLALALQALPPAPAASSGSADVPRQLAVENPGARWGPLPAKLRAKKACFI